MTDQQHVDLSGYAFDSSQLKQIKAWTKQLSRSLKPGRFVHSLSVADTSVHLAEVHGLDIVRAEQAGLLHDCAKCLSPKEMRRIAEKHSLTDDEAVLSNPGLLHSIVGAWVAEKDYGMDDPLVLQAIRYHNTGFPGMSRLDMCVCLADSIEPLRENYPNLEDIRMLSVKSLEGALLFSLETTAAYVASRGWFLHPRTEQTITWLRELPGTKNCRGTSD